jgi:DNA-binding NarL/FixJ family response regulator
MNGSCRWDDFAKGPLHGIMDFDPQAKVFLISVLEPHEVLRDAFKASATGFLPKPLNRENLHASLARSLSDSTR